MNSAGSFIALMLFAISGSPVTAKGDPLPRSTPESQGVSSEAILKFVEAADEGVNTMNSLMVMRHGKVIAEGWWAPYGPGIPHVLYSLSKSFTSTAVGLAVEEGKLGIDDEVSKFFPEDLPADPSNNLKAMRLRDLLCMSTGHQTEPRLSETNPEPWTRQFLAHPVAFKPGTHFLYNTAGTYMQSAIVQKATGQTVLEYLKPRLFEPLGIENPTWGTSPQGVSLGGYGLNLKTEDIARFGQLYLQHGRWEGKQIIPAAWVEMATTKQTSNGSNPNSDWDQGYGFQFWRCRNGAYRGDGAFGQFCVVMPEQDAVIAITSGTKDMQGVLNLVWEHLLPAMGAAILLENANGHKALRKRLSALSLKFPEGKSFAPRSTSWMGKEFVFEPNGQGIEAVKLESDSTQKTVIEIRAGGASQKIACGHNYWEKGRITYGSFKDQPVAAAGAWREDGTFVAKLCFYESPTFVTLTLKPDGEGLSYEAEYNVAFGPGKQPELKGKRKI